MQRGAIRCGPEYCTKVCLCTHFFKSICICCQHCSGISRTHLVLLGAGPDPKRPTELEESRAESEKLLTAATLDITVTYKDAVQFRGALSDLSLSCSAPVSVKHNTNGQSSNSARFLKHDVCADMQSPNLHIPTLTCSVTTPEYKNARCFFLNASMHNKGRYSTFCRRQAASGMLLLIVMWSLWDLVPAVV